MKFYDIPESLELEINELEHNILLFRKGELEAPKFKVFRVPFGIYEQRKADTYMVRIRLPGGAVTPLQLLAVSKLSKLHGSGMLHITTRQELQIHMVELEKIPLILRELLKAGLSTRGGGGNTVRNIIASWDSGIALEEMFDVMPYVSSLTSLLIKEKDSWTLPRKYKIAFSNSLKDNSHAAFNDLGFIAIIKNGEKGFKVYAAGGMGSKPKTGEVIHEFIPAASFYSVAKAIKEIFSIHGNRKNRHAARLRFLWNKLGREKFLEIYNSLLTEPKAFLSDIPNIGTEVSLKLELNDSQDFKLWKQRYVRQQKQEGLFSILLPVWLGDIKSEEASVLAEALEPFGENVLRCTLDQNFSLRNIPEKYLGNIFNSLKGISDLTQLPKLIGSSVACTGSATCKLGICLSQGALTAVRNKLLKSELKLDELSDLKIHISGCPNTCGAHMIADLGFYGKALRSSTHIYPAYVIVAGAKVDGNEPGLATIIDEISARDLPEFVVRFLKLWTEKKHSFAAFSEYISASGKEDIQNICKTFKNIPPFEENKNYYFDWGSDQIFSLVGKGKGECSAGLFDLIELDMELIRKLKIELQNSDDKNIIYRLRLSSCRALLVTRGVEPGNDKEVFDNFIKLFIKTKLIDEKYLPVIEGREDNKNLVMELAQNIEQLYAVMDDTLHFPQEKIIVSVPAMLKDFRGVACPMNFVKTKMELSKLKKGERLKILLDDGPPIENVPRSVEEEGHKIIEQTKTGDHWSVLIEKD